MTGEVVNLRQARKRRDRELRETDAAANRQLHGRTKAQKTAERAAREKADAHLDGHRREPE